MEHSITLPLHLLREQGDPIIRAGLVVNWDDRSYYCGGEVPQGSKVRFSIAPDFDVIENVIDGCEELKATEIPEADALLLFNCAGRLLSLGPLIGEEIEGIRKVWEAPMAGMFSNAEMARATGGNLEVHGLTACCVVLKEKCMNQHLQNILNFIQRSGHLNAEKKTNLLQWTKAVDKELEITAFKLSVLKK